MVAGVHDNPLCAEPAVGIDIASEMPVDGFGHKRRNFRDVDGREGVQAEMDTMLLACSADTSSTRIVKAGQGIVGRVKLDIDVSDTVSRRPCDGLLEPQTVPNSDPDPVPQRDFIAPLRPDSNQFSRNQLRRHSYFRLQPSLPRMRRAAP